MTIMRDLIDEISMGPFGSDIKVENFKKSGVPVLNGSNISGVKLTEDFENFLTLEKADSLKKANAVSGDIVITHRGTLGQVAYIPFNCNYDRYVISQSQFKVRLKAEIIDPVFFTYYFHTSEGQKRLLSFKNHVGVPALAQATTNFRLLEFPLIPLENQKKIAKVLSDLDAKIELNNKINAELEAMAKMIYDYWFVQFDFPDENGKPYKSSGGKMVYNEELKREIPEGWEVKELGDLLFQVSDSIEPDEYPNLKYLPIDKLPTKQLYYDRYEKRSEANSSLIRFLEDDILLGAMRVYFHRVCNAAEDGISRSTLMVLRAKVKYHKNFGLFTLNREEAIEYATKNSTGTSIPYAKWNSNMEKYKICVADRETLFIDFNKIVDPILEKFKVLTGENRKLIELRDWLLPMLMNGQVTVN